MHIFRFIFFILYIEIGKFELLCIFFHPKYLVLLLNKNIFLFFFSRLFKLQFLYFFAGAQCGPMGAQVVGR